MTHVRTSPYYPQSNGKIERWHGTVKRECIRPGVLLNLEDARQVVTKYVDHYNNVRPNSAIGYIVPADKLKGKDKQILSECDRKLDTARQARKEQRKSARYSTNNSGSDPAHQKPAPPTNIQLGPILAADLLMDLSSEVDREMVVRN